jgi:iron complex transport system ATP-binding protein
MTEGGTAIEAKGLCFGYEERAVLDRVDLRIAEGEFIALLGPNGAGKTTLLHLVSGVLSPRSGSVSVFGQDVGAMKPRDKCRLIGVVPQESVSNFNFTNLEIVLMGRVVHTSRFGNESRDDFDRALSAMRRTRTEHLATRGFMEISGGEKQRVIIAQVLAQETKILLLDEPTANLDINYQIEIMELIRAVKEEHNLTVVAVLHDMNSAAQYAERVVLLKDGKIRYDDRPDSALVPSNIFDIYGTHVMTATNPSTNKPYIVPLYDRHADTSPLEIPKRRIHVFAGGGSGSYLFSVLARDGHELSASILCSVDADQKVAESLGIPVTAGRIAPGCAPLRREMKRLLSGCDSLVFARFPITAANYPALLEAVEAIETWSEVYVIDPDGAAVRDRMNGRGCELYRIMRERGAVAVESEESLARRLRKEALSCSR